jgi:hypothetical protein
VIRTSRPLLTPDLTRLGPPELAAAAAQSGWTSSMVVPLQAGRARFGGLQLLGSASQPVHSRDGEALQVVVDVLVARLVDVRALRMLAAPRVAQATRVDPADVATTVLPVVPASSAPARRAPVVPAPRRPQARHRKVESGGSVGA